MSLKIDGHIDKRGALYPIDMNEVGFIPKHMFWVSNVPIGKWRGSHAHRKSNQFIICMNGKVRIRTYAGSNESTIAKDSRETCLNIGDTLCLPNLTWINVQYLTGNDTILVLCSEKYDEDDYIKDIGIFYTITKNE